MPTACPDESSVYGPVGQHDAALLVHVAISLSRMRIIARTSEDGTHGRHRRLATAQRIRTPTLDNPEF
jgi:hypothetical protein